MNVPLNGDYDFGFRLKSDDEPAVECSLPDEAFEMVTHTNWEADLIWEYTDKDRRNVYHDQISNAGVCSWIPSPDCRSISRFYQSLNDMGLLKDYHGPYLPPAARQVMYPDGKRKRESLFPFESKELVHDSWEDVIIWDPLAMKRIPSPLGLVIDPNDSYLLTSMPDDVAPDREVQESQHMEPDSRQERKSRILAFSKNNAEADEDNEEDDDEIRTLTSKNPWNLSNDEFYNPKQQGFLKANIGGSVLQHSIPALDLHRIFFPTSLAQSRLRTWHRAGLKRFSKGPMSEPGKKPVVPLAKYMQKKFKQREQERDAFGGGQLFQMRRIEDLSAMDGEVALFEYCEEFPPIMMQPGMATKVRNYFRRTPDKSIEIPKPKYGDLSYAGAHSSPFLGNLSPGEMLQALENNMFRAPIYPHRMPNTDFLIIRTRNEYSVREIPDIFTVGQLLPLFEVAGPKSKTDQKFQQSFLVSYIYRLFLQSKRDPKRVKTEDVRRAFSYFSETTLRKRLKVCADFKRSGADQGWWFHRKTFRFPSDEELRMIVTPEQCCAHYSMHWAKKRLKEAGYGGKSLFTVDDDGVDLGRKIEDEVLNAPWNTTRAYISAVKGKCLLQLNGPCDPTGCGEGFSYQKMSFKHINKDDPLGVGQNKRAVTGTDADLRKLPLKEAKSILRRFGLPDSEIKKMGRWEMIDYIRTLSTERAKSGRDVFSERFARLAKFSTTDHLRKFQDDCQSLFDRQNRTLGSEEMLSSEEDVSSSDDESDVEMEKNLENILENRKSKIRTLEHEEKERQELNKWLLGEGATTSNQTQEEKDLAASQRKDIDFEGKVLKITRTFRSDDTGELFTREEVVRRSEIIQSYVKIRQSKDSAEINQLTLSIDTEKKEELKKQKRRIQDRIRRLTTNMQKGVYPKKPRPPPPPPKEKKEVPLPKVHCSACGAYGHIRTNKVCPYYVGSQQVAMTEEQEAEMAKDINAEPGQLVSVEDTKVRFNKQLVQLSNTIRHKSLQLKIPRIVQRRNPPPQPKEKKPKGQRGRPRAKKPGCRYLDHLSKPKRTVQRRRIDPMVSLATIFTKVIAEAKDLPDTDLFLKPVNPKMVPDYHRIIQRPMDIQTIRQKIDNRQYETRESILRDLQLIVQNSRLYNGPTTVLTLAAESMLELCVRRFAEKERKIMKLEKAINPLMDENDLIAISYIFQQIALELKRVEHSWPFHDPVNQKKVKGYFEKIQIPMDLSTILKNVSDHRYHNRTLFIRHVRLIYQNCRLFNGPNHAFTKTAEKIVSLCEQMIEANDAVLRGYEQNIDKTKQAALDDIESSSVATSNTTHTRDEAMEVDAGAFGEDELDFPQPSVETSVASPQPVSTMMESSRQPMEPSQEDSNPFDPDAFFSSSILKDEHAARKTSVDEEESNQMETEVSTQILNADLECSDSDGSI